jgi:hypothetical protein
MKNKKGVKVNHYKIALSLAKMFNSAEFGCEGVKYVKVGNKYVKVNDELYKAIKNLK